MGLFERNKKEIIQNAGLDKKMNLFDQILGRMPSEIKELLYFSEENPDKAVFGRRTSITFDIDSDEVLEEELEPTDPSTIYRSLQIRKPKSEEEVNPPSYFPNYVGLSPVQRFIYLNWLTDISSPIDIGYVFIFFYGLEKQLLFGNFDLAFKITQKLLEHHGKFSFVYTAKNSLIYASVIKGRVDKLAELQNLLEHADKWDNLELLIAYYSDWNLTSEDIIKIIKGLKDTNKRYIKTQYNLYLQSLDEVLEKRFGTGPIYLRNIIDSEQLKNENVSVFSNISFPEEIRNMDCPFVKTNEKFLATFTSIGQETHEITKTKNKNK